MLVLKLPQTTESGLFIARHVSACWGKPRLKSWRAWNVRYMRANVKAKIKKVVLVMGYNAPLYGIRDRPSGNGTMQTFAIVKCCDGYPRKKIDNL